ncbi:hypothetical protein SCLCIDRAFT_32589 [Scleroderma citrinum Foug A]|uniref:Uncharacterized protein n=1 Tax=Scleroderma citrinum Foug A TaxID=1036808 RepID=A0A0C2ZID2_9AGAM|nr:hypothetical protein SCLCIDRAFT_32589 [Scleroderma citrinum Foug A]
MDGNFKAKHMWPKNPANEVWLMDGMGFMVTMLAYKDYLAGTLNQVEQKLKNAAEALIPAEEAFAELDVRIPSQLHEVWAQQEKLALENRGMDPKLMDIFEVQLEKAPTRKSIEMDIISNQASDGLLRGAATWMARVLEAEESQIILAMDAWCMQARATETQRLSIAHQQDRLNATLDWLFESTARFLGDDWNENNPSHLIVTANIDEDDGNDIFGDTLYPHHPSQSDGVILPLPSYLTERPNSLGPASLADQELRLREGQANDALHELRVALANEAVIFRTDVRHARTYNMTTRAWGRVASANVKVQQQAEIYCQCHTQMLALNAGDDLLVWYKVLRREDLKVSAAVADPNARGHRDNTLAWFWTMDMPWDTEPNNGE